MLPLTDQMDYLGNVDPQWTGGFTRRDKTRDQRNTFVNGTLLFVHTHMLIARIRLRLDTKPRCVCDADPAKVCIRHTQKLLGQLCDAPVSTGTQ